MPYHLAHHYRELNIFPHKAEFSPVMHSNFINFYEASVNVFLLKFEAIIEDFVLIESRYNHSISINSYVIDIRFLRSLDWISQFNHYLTWKKSNSELFLQSQYTWIPMIKKTWDLRAPLHTHAHTKWKLIN